MSAEEPRPSPSRLLLEAATGALERPTSRRSFLARATLAATALAVAPLRYLLRPGTAWAVIRPSDCGPGSRCNDGYTEFCCATSHGHNTCPPNTFVGGWWKCTYYAGRRLCADRNVRYYIDCNMKPGHRFPGGCQCASGDCGRRRAGCNVFRYGQCNAQIGAVTPIACRVVVCENPARVPGFHCNSTYKEDDVTCGHDAGCLSEANVEIIGRNPGA